jgi:hypothetical protein
MELAIIFSSEFGRRLRELIVAGVGDDRQGRFSAAT